MELPYVHGVRFEAANFAWVAQMRGETRRFLVKKHGFVKSRLCAIEKIEMWRAALSPEALASELKGTLRWARAAHSFSVSLSLVAFSRYCCCPALLLS